jgi:hypothetical protein
MKSILTNRKQTASFRIVSFMLAVAPLWLILAAANTSAQTSNDVFQFHHHHQPRALTRGLDAISQRQYAALEPV